MVGLTTDPRIASTNMAFEVYKEHIISRIAYFCGQGDTIKIYATGLCLLVSPINYTSDEYTSYLY